MDAVVTELQQLAESKPAIELETLDSENSNGPAEPEQDAAAESE